MPYSIALARRDYLNNPDARAKMAETGQGIGHLANIPAKSTRRYGMSDLHRAMMTAAALNASVGGCAGAVRRHMERRGDNPDGVVPCGQRFSSRLAGVDMHEAIDSFCGMAAAQLKDLEKAGIMPEGGWTMAPDMHKIGRYDRTRGEELTRSKYENGTMHLAVHERAVRRRGGPPEFGVTARIHAGQRARKGQADTGRVHKAGRPHQADPARQGVLHGGYHTGAE